MYFESSITDWPGWKISQVPSQAQAGAWVSSGCSQRPGERARLHIVAPQRLTGPEGPAQGLGHHFHQLPQPHTRRQLQIAGRLMVGPFDRDDHTLQTIPPPVMDPDMDRHIDWPADPGSFFGQFPSGTRKGTVHLGDTGWLVLDNVPADELPSIHCFWPYVLCRNRYVQDVSYHYAEYHGHQAPWK